MYQFHVEPKCCHTVLLLVIVNIISLEGEMYFKSSNSFALFWEERIFTHVQGIWKSRYVVQQYSFKERSFISE